MPSNFWTDPATKPLIVAHRGGAALAAENTLAAFEAAATIGADAIETDVRMTRDGALVCLHDADLQRLCGDPRAVAELDLATLQGLLPTVMTLDVALAASAPMGLLLDVKLRDRTSLADIVHRVERGKAVERTLLGLRSLDFIAVARSARTDIAILAFLEDPESAAAAGEAGANWFRLWQGVANPARAIAVRDAGMHLAIMVGQPRTVPLPGYPPFPVGLIDRDGLESLRPLAPDAILLDDPRLAVAAGY
ncbi:glycerophosphoryl diester phosphodiesterase [Sinorhizobium kostiense]|uniref:Glycerophosphoryl diester phosphodiesterase n=1 Tax=Sinorhizobium kostiense TaxID=76747 RepID=A0ABS4R629_9HYPH|nr:glycerophosphodiester phosphodiesterase family protein [Sinorhizobium kostiense]MBP2238347.1 glycerophosphoryl diester phosphodiesterase [Sinorhizobium kostiense]